MNEIGILFLRLVPWVLSNFLLHCSRSWPSAKRWERRTVCYVDTRSCSALQGHREKYSHITTQHCVAAASPKITHTHPKATKASKSSWSWGWCRRSRRLLALGLESAAHVMEVHLPLFSFHVLGEILMRRLFRHRCSARTTTGNLNNYRASTSHAKKTHIGKVDDALTCRQLRACGRGHWLLGLLVYHRSIHCQAKPVQLLLMSSWISDQKETKSNKKMRMR